MAQNRGPIDLLRDAKAKIADPEHWLQKRLALNKAGYSVPASNPKAVAWCADGALIAVSAESPSAMWQARQALWDVMGSITVFNDSHTHAQVMDAFDRAITRLERP